MRVQFELVIIYSNVRSLGKCFQGDLNMISAVLGSFKDNLFRRNNWTKSFNSWLITDSIVPSFLAGNKRLLSSAKR